MDKFVPFKGKIKSNWCSINTEIKETRRKYKKWYNYEHQSINHHQQPFDRFEIHDHNLNKLNLLTQCTTFNAFYHNITY